MSPLWSKIRPFTTDFALARIVAALAASKAPTVLKR